MQDSPSGLQSLFEELKRRRVVRALVAYTAAVFALLQGAQPIFEGLLLPDLALRILVIVSIAGLPVVLVLAWVYELTAEGIRRTPKDPKAAPPRRAPLRRWLQVAGVFVMAFVIVAATAAGLGRLRFPASASDGRVALAIFPFRGPEWLEEPWSEGVADLLATALDGTVGLRIVDPWALWRPLREQPNGRAEPPDPETAARLAHDAGAHRYLLGSVVRTGERVDLNIRLYQLGRADPIATFGVSGTNDGMLELLNDAAVRVLSRVWGARRPADLPTELDFDATDSPEALKAYLAAKEAMRRGDADSAVIAIDRAVALDSTFVLAIVDGVTIRTWASFARGQQFAGFLEQLDRAEALADSVSPRTRLRLESIRASVQTNGARAYAAARGILEIDPSDLEARLNVSYYQRAYGWQFGAETHESRQWAEDLVRTDSTSIPVLLTRAVWSVALVDTVDLRVQLRRIENADTITGLARGWREGLRAILASDAAFDASIPSLITLPAIERLSVLRLLRWAKPQRAEAMYQAMAQSPDPTAVAQALAELARLDVARGHAARVDSAIAAGTLREISRSRALERLIVTAALAGIGDDSVTARTVRALEAYVPMDSALAVFQTRPVWATAWAVGAWHAQMGDTVRARRWNEVIGTFPPGGSSRDYVGALQADIAARLANRRGDLDTALKEAHRAFDLWTIHADNALESTPPPLMRFHMGTLLRQAGQPDSARSLFRSLVPPATWMGFLTTRASGELGEIALEKGDTAEAIFYLTRALQLLEKAGPGGLAWQARARERLASLGNR